jgi:hypothetical protein
VASTNVQRHRSEQGIERAKLQCCVVGGYGTCSHTILMQTPPDSRLLHNDMCHICIISNSNEVVKSPSAEYYIMQSWLLFLTSAMRDNSYFTSEDIHLSHFGYCYCEATWEASAELLHTGRFEQVILANVTPCLLYLFYSSIAITKFSFDRARCSM